MDEEVVHRCGSRWDVRITRGSPRGDLYEMEVRTCFRVVDRARNEVALTREGLYEATYRDGGWTDATYTGVRTVSIAPDDLWAIVHYADGREEAVPLPGKPPTGREGLEVEPDRRITLDRIDTLLAYREALERPGRSFLLPAESGAPALPFPRYAADVFAFIMEAGRPWWSDYGYSPNEAGRLVLDQDRVAAATLDEVRTMLTFIVRGERFGDGHWLRLLESGRVQAVLRRLVELRNDPGARVSG